MALIKKIKVPGAPGNTLTYHRIGEVINTRNTSPDVLVQLHSYSTAWEYKTGEKPRILVPWFKVSAAALGESPTVAEIYEAVLRYAEDNAAAQAAMPDKSDQEFLKDNLFKQFVGATSDEDA